MQYRNLVVRLMLAATLLFLFACTDDDNPTSPPSIPPLAFSAEEEINSTQVLVSADFLADPGRGATIQGAGMTILESMDSAEFSTPTVTSTHPFNYLFPEWKATVPVSSTLEIRVRTATMDGDWSDWHFVDPYPDGHVEGSGMEVGGMIDTGDALTTHHRAQIEVTLAPSPIGESPVFEQLNLVFVNSTEGLTTQQILHDMESKPDGKLPRQQTDGKYPKPRIIPRSQWCSHADCNYSDGLQYEPVTHLLVHHTVSNNATTDWATNVRGIWNFHTYSRGWGDVGYNYLIDPNGNIYEGHIGGDDVIGTHAADANRGGMGVALLGTFGTTDPPPAMLEALAELMAWKTDQKDIDLWDASRMPLLDWGLLHLVGHRDVYGTTECPGGLAHAHIDEVRQSVADKIGFVPEYQYIDELSAQFTRANANWHVGPFACGFNSHVWNTFSTTDPNLSVNWGEWRPNIAESGRYQVDAFIPFCRTGQEETRQAPYTISHAGGVTNLVRNQQDHVGLWMSLGDFNFNAGGDNVIRLGDFTSSENNAPIWFDVIRVKPLDTTPDTTPPTSRINAVFKECNGDVRLEWFGEDAESGIRNYDVSYKRDFDANWTTVASGVTEMTLTFTPPDQTSNYRYRVQARDNQGNLEPLKANGDAGSDQAIPCSIAAPTNITPSGDVWVNNNPVRFTWRADAPQAIALYQLEVATDADFNGIVLTQDLPASETAYSHSFDDDFDRLFWRIRAVTIRDEQLISEHSSFRLDATAPDARVTAANQTANGNWQLAWEASDALSGVSGVTVEFSGEETSQWTTVVANAQGNSATFTPANPDGLYLFRATATDFAGNEEANELTGDFNTSLGCPYLDEPVAHLVPAPDQWRSNRELAFRWSTPRAQCVLDATIEIATDATFANIVHSSSTTSRLRTSYEFTADDAFDELFWRVTQTTVVNESFTSAPTRVQFDTTAPTSTVTGVQRQVDGLGLIVSAESSDTQSGVTTYIFEYRVDGTEQWQRFATGSASEVLFVSPNQTDTYWFRVRAVDAAGNTAEGSLLGDVSSADLTPIKNLYLPITIRE